MAPIFPLLLLFVSIFAESLAGQLDQARCSRDSLRKGHVLLTPPAKNPSPIHVTAISLFFPLASSLSCSLLFSYFLQPVGDGLMHEI